MLAIMLAILRVFPSSSGMSPDQHLLNNALAINSRQDLKTRALPIQTQDVLGKNFARTLELELKYGNGDLIKVLNILGIAGPFKLLSPWELQDEEGRHLINAGGYSALPFGEMYPPLVDFLQEYLKHNQSSCLPQGVTSSWRAALETNLIALLARQAPSHVDSQVFFSNSGAEAVEAAIKFAKAARP
jgi:acetylornithine/succinyldiaminopimelate/putrescine aminotransferase